MPSKIEKLMSLNLEPDIRRMVEVKFGTDFLARTDSSSAGGSPDDLVDETFVAPYMAAYIDRWQKEIQRRISEIMGWGT